MYTLALQEFEECTKLDYYTILTLYLREVIPAPLLYCYGTYRWDADHVADFIINHGDEYNIDIGTRCYWENYVKLRDLTQAHDCMDMDSEHTPSEYFEQYCIG